MAYRLRPRFNQFTCLRQVKALWWMCPSIWLIPQIPIKHSHYHPRSSIANELTKLVSSPLPCAKHQPFKLVKTPSIGKAKVRPTFTAPRSRPCPGRLPAQNEIPSTRMLSLVTSLWEVECQRNPMDEPCAIPTNSERNLYHATNARTICWVPPSRTYLTRLKTLEKCAQTRVNKQRSASSSPPSTVNAKALSSCPKNWTERRITLPTPVTWWIPEAEVSCSNSPLTDRVSKCGPRRELTLMPHQAWLHQLWLVPRSSRMETQLISPTQDAPMAAPTSYSESMTDKNQAWVRAKKVLCCRLRQGRISKIAHLWEVPPRIANITALRATTRFKSSRINLNTKA